MIQAPPGGGSRLKGVARRMIWRAMSASGALGLARAHRTRRGRGSVAVLCFHRVSPDVPEDAITISPARFRDICATLRAHYDVIAAAECVRRLREGVPMTGREAVVTFDDGYADNFEYAAPILREAGLPGTFFLTAGYVGTNQRFPWDVEKNIAGPLMTWAQASQMKEMGFEIGCHTWSHPDLGVTPVVEAGRELHRARALIEDRIGSAVTHFAYPFGGRANITPEWVEAVKAEGFSSLFCAYGGLATSRDHAFWIPRLNASHQRTIADLRIDMDEPW